MWGWGEILSGSIAIFMLIFGISYRRNTMIRIVGQVRGMGQY